ncbi:MAG: hypothetical protein ACHQQS_06175 [Thermoanaerobaculales bacterium]
MTRAPGGTAQDSLLTPYLAKLASFLAACPDDEKPVSVTFGGGSFVVDAWERRAAFRALSHQGRDIEPWQRVLAEGIALQIALIRWLAGLQAAEPEGAIAAEEALASAVAAGSPIIEALKMEAEEACATGEAERARRLRTFRDRLAEALSQAWHAISGAELTWEAVADPLPPSAAPVPVEAGPEAPKAASAPVTESASVHAPPAEAQNDPLGPLVARAAAFLRIRASEDRPLEIRFGPRRLGFTLWQRRLLWQSLVERHTPAHEWQRLIVEGVVLQLALLPQIEELERRQADSEASRPIAHEVAKNLRLTPPVVEGLRVTLEQLVRQGQAENARHVTAFRNAFADTVRDARSALLALAVRQGATTDAPDPATDRPSLSSLAGIDPDLEPYYERAGRLLRMQGHEERSVTISIGARAWQFTAWERGILWQALCQEGIPGASWVSLAAKCAVLQLGLLLEIEKQRQLARDEGTRERSRRVVADLAERARLALEDLRAAATSLNEEGQGEVASQLMDLASKIKATLLTVRVSG